VRGYLLIELLFALLIVTISLTSFAYYTYYKVRIHNNAIQECQALSLARNEIERASTKPGCRTYTHDIFTVFCDSRRCGLKGSYQKQLHLIEVEVVWTCMNGTRRSIFLTTVV
jgi:Tfp pilus assembly protein PilV